MPTLKQSKAKIVKGISKSKFLTYKPALMGRPDGGGAFTYSVPGGQGYTYVRMLQGSSTVLSMALNRAGIANTGDLPIWIDRDLDGRKIIVSARYT